MKSDIEYDVEKDVIPKTALENGTAITKVNTLPGAISIRGIDYAGSSHDEDETSVRTSTSSSSSREKIIVPLASVVVHEDRPSMENSDIFLKEAVEVSSLNHRESHIVKENENEKRGRKLFRYSVLFCCLILVALMAGLLVAVLHDRSERSSQTFLRGGDSDSHASDHDEPSSLQLPSTWYDDEGGDHYDHQGKKRGNDDRTHDGQGRRQSGGRHDRDGGSNDRDGSSNNNGGI